VRAFGATHLDDDAWAFLSHELPPMNSARTLCARAVKVYAIDIFIELV
jgi:hypothetical protein